jgi:hypothetical protein
VIGADMIEKRGRGLLAIVDVEIIEIDKTLVNSSFYNNQFLSTS